MIEGSFEIVDRQIIGHGSLVDLEELTVRSGRGDEFTRDVVRHPGGVGILAIDDGRVWLIRQHRVAVGGEIDEIPAGTLDSDDPDPESAARRELLEEVGATAGRLSHLATMAPSPGYTSEVIEIFLAEDLEFGERSPDGEEEQDATVFFVPVDEALDRIDRGDLTDAKTLVALLQWKRRQG